MSWPPQTQIGSASSTRKKPVVPYKIYLREQDMEEQRLVGQQALNRALKLFNVSIKDLTESDWLELLQWRHIETKDQLFEQIAVGDFTAAIGCESFVCA